MDNKLDFVELEWHARQLRAAELQRISSITEAHMQLMAGLAWQSIRSGLSILNAFLRRLFSWNPLPHEPMRIS